MRRPLLCAALSLFFASSFCTHAKAQSAEPASAPEYAKTTNWVCRPGAEDVCTTGLDWTIVHANGQTVRQAFKPAANPAIDCFYVYPTVSQEQSDYSDMADSPEVQRVVKAQAGRLTSRCRVFAPIYRQATAYHLRQKFSGDGVTKADFPTADIAAAWNYYLQHDNHGRGVVLIGHSQGTIVLQDLIAKQIDGTRVQSLLVSAFLAGDPSLGVPEGKHVGGTFQHIPVCSAAAQIGCAYAWGSFLAPTTTNDTAKQVFGHLRRDNLVSACANPAAPGGGTGKLKFFHQKAETASANDPPWVEDVDQLTGACSTTAGGNGFRITIAPGPHASELTALLKQTEGREGWGLHPRDIGLVQGNILDVLDAEIAAWQKTH